MTRARFLAIAIGGAALTGCAHKKHPVAQLPPAPTPSAAPPQQASSPHPRHPRPLLPSDLAPESGTASWYGHPYHGRPSASGEIYDMEQMTAAHRTLPFGTMVHVEDLDNGMSTDVRINDRGPFVDGRIIDLSHAAARAINMLGPGIANVRLTINAPPLRPEPAVFAVQIGAFANRDNADRMQARMISAYGSAALRLRAGAPALWRVLVGQAPTPEAAETLAGQIRGEQSVPEAFVVRLDPPITSSGGALNPPTP